MYLHFNFQKKRPSYSFWQHKKSSVIHFHKNWYFSSCFFFLFSEHKTDRRTMLWIRAKKGQNRKATSTISAKNLFSKSMDNTKNAFFFFGTLMSRSFSSCFFSYFKRKACYQVSFFWLNGATKNTKKRTTWINRSYAKIIDA